jgi:hypothetical protein
VKFDDAPLSDEYRSFAGSLTLAGRFTTLVGSIDTILDNSSQKEWMMGANHAGERKRAKAKNTKKIIEAAIKRAQAKETKAKG